ncbi:hypothetical protein G6L35_08695 [Agrobacterium tumefaciens]|uniref:hypothetical protein n=1 Tax=Agrobacterium tumefaciens TaxID=358 RepID=UPI001574A60B|nr:hypothetical protein [Agrobacterium tumefaciens]NSZ68708.1 hypothetical protein [Agrobacterium tumefaciens]
MTKVVNSSEYSTNSIFVGCSVNEDGEPLVVINGKAVGTVDGLLDFIGKYRDQQKAGSANIEIGNDEQIAKLRRRLDELESSISERVEMAVRSAKHRNVKLG